jgi:hypothetical protein
VGTFSHESHEHEALGFTDLVNRFFRSQSTLKP